MENYKSAKLFDADGDLSRRWNVYFFFKDPTTNKFIRWREWISLKVPTRNQRYEIAREKIKRINTKLTLGFNPFSDKDRGQMKILESLDYAFDCKVRSTRRRTFMSYKSHIKRFKAFLKINNLDNIAISDLNSRHAQEFLDWYQVTYKIANRTYNNERINMVAIFNFLKRREFVLANPFSKVDKLAIEEPDIIALNTWERKIIHDRLPDYNHDLFIIAELIFNCFLRPQELVRLQVNHLKIEAGNIIVPGNVSKNKKNEVIQMPKGLIKKLAGFDLNFPGNYYLFSTNLKRGKKQIFPQRITEHWNKFCLTYGLNKPIYALKHTGNGMAIEKGINIRDIQLQNRHHNLQVTQQYLDRFSKIPSEKLINQFPEL